ncbi:ImmA/IrrE family metallo-endopeptidase [Phosphitispora sp. TUW77]|uniref:ImmA/IrrE family metallo-endopeptidase n=1 Tax=Phosphitispora sp. TUW77 TaxID=3152361 RepID=UPI003AB28B7B
MNIENLIYQELLEIANQRGIFLDFVDLPNKIDGFWFYIKNKTDAIAINRVLAGNKRNFTLAHELGHSALHKNSNYNVLTNGGKLDEKMEAEADEYARILITKIKKNLRKEVTLNIQK